MTECKCGHMESSHSGNGKCMGYATPTEQESEKLKKLGMPNVVLCECRVFRQRR